MNGISNNQHPIRVPSDLEGIKLRVMGYKIAIRQWPNVGADVISMDFADVYTALQQGTVHGQTNVPSITYQNFGDVQNYYTHTNWLYENCPMLANKDSFYSLPEEFQEAMREEMLRAFGKYHEGALARDEEYLQKGIDDYGWEVIRNADLTKEEKALWINTQRSFWPTFEDMVGADILQTLMAKATPIE